MEVNAYGSPMASLDRVQDIVRGGEALVVTDENSCSRGIKYIFNILPFSRIRLILKSFRFVAVRIHAEGRNLQGSRVVHA